MARLAEAGGGAVKRERPLPCHHKHLCRAKPGLTFRYWLHPAGDCIAAGAEIGETEVPDWNRRA